MNNGLKNILLGCTTALTIVCVLVGTKMHIGGGVHFYSPFTAITEKLVNKVDDKIITHFGKKDHGSGEKDDNHTLGNNAKNVDVSFEEEIKELRLDLDLGDVDIAMGGENRLVIHCGSEKLVPEYELKNGVLTVAHKSNKYINLFDDKEVKVSITVQDELEVLFAELDMGDLDVDGIVAKTIELDLDMGDMDITNVVTDSISAKLAMGDGSVDKLVAADADLDMSMGSMTVRNSVIQKGRVENSMGDVNFEDVEFDNMKVELSAGDMSLYLPFAKDECDIYANVSAGDLSIDGKSVGNSYSSKGESRALNVSCDLGDISIEFAK